MKMQSKNWTDTVIALLIMMNSLLLVHLLHYAVIVEQSAQIMAVLLFYAWLAQWIKRP